LVGLLKWRHIRAHDPQLGVGVREAANAVEVDE
jgi:hypothetical protein